MNRKTGPGSGPSQPLQFGEHGGGDPDSVAALTLEPIQLELSWDEDRPSRIRWRSAVQDLAKVCDPRRNPIGSAEPRGVEEQEEVAEILRLARRVGRSPRAQR